MILYNTVKKEAIAEQIIERSRFITRIKPVETKEEADAFIVSVRKANRDATHNVPAMVIGDQFQIQWASDDGEPQGTSGAPIVQYLVKEGITNVALVVTRYFGGIKLGTGGLVRAYTSSARLGVEAAGVRAVKKKYYLTVSLAYPFLARVENMCRETSFEILDIVYTDVVTMEIVTEIGGKEELRKRLTDITGGTEKIVSEVEKNA